MKRIIIEQFEQTLEQAQKETDKIVSKVEAETDKTVSRFCMQELKGLDYLHDTLYSPLMDRIMVTVTSTGNFGFIWIFTAIILLVAGDRPRIGYPLLIALLLGIIIGNLIIKNTVKRSRPFFHKHYKLLIKQPWDYSFPSGHTLSSFAAATVLCYMNQSVGVIAICYACLIALSRLYLRVHFFTDVFFSMVLGTGLGMLAMKIYETSCWGLITLPW